FHEVGGHDAVVDIVGSAVALELLGVDEVAASPVAQGVGVVRSAHGLLPNPAPATVALLTGIPTLGRELSVELTTPTGAAMLRAWSSHFGALPDSELVACGYGAGTRELEGVPNCTQVVIGLRRAGGSGSFDDVLSRGGEELVVLEANLDDVTGETLSGALDEAMRAGALDAWITPVVMKKGRPAHVMSVLCEPVVAGQLAGVLMATTGTLGVRLSKTRRVSSTRSLDEVDLDGYRVRMKVSPGRVKAEHDDVARVAARSGTPVIELAARAEAAWRARARPATAGSSPSALDKDPGDDVSPSPPGA
ncbi:MAG: LarC family nickel insertion protein, partial [Acidimicrobiales bacterium]